MADQLQFRGGTTEEHKSFVGAEKEMTVDTDKNTAVIHDGKTAGGHPLVTEKGLEEKLAAVKPPDVKPATEKAPGIVRLATPKEAATEWSNTIAVTPAGLKAFREALPFASEVLRGFARYATVPESINTSLEDAAITPRGLAAVLNSKLQDATNTVPGIVRLATPEETKAGNINTVAVTPAGLAALPTPPPPPSATTAIQGLSRFATVAEALAGWFGGAAVTPEGLSAKVKEGWELKFTNDTSFWWRCPNGLIIQTGARLAGGTPGQVGWNRPHERTLWAGFPITFPQFLLSAMVLPTANEPSINVVVTHHSTAGLGLAATCNVDVYVWWLAMGI